MRINIYVRPRLEHQPYWLGAFSRGLKAHGVDHEIRDATDVAPCDIAVMWGWKNPQAAQAAGRTVVLERGYIGDRKHWTSLGFDGLNGRADFGTDLEHVDSSRWDRHFPDRLQEWRFGRGYDLVIGQVPGDASLAQVDYRGWLDRVAEALTGLDVVFRPHPLYPQQRVPRGMRRSEGSLDEDLAGARRCITCNSNTGVDALLAGIPTVTMDRGAMAYPITSHDLYPLPPRIDRTEWCHRMAWCQWTIDEMSSGEAWEHLRRVAERGAHG